jgi:hypothetical protein
MGVVAGLVQGVDLARRFYDEGVAPVLDGVAHAAALLGSSPYGFGCDTARPTDREGVSRLQVFVERRDVRSVRERIEAALPHEYRGGSTLFGWDDLPVSHHVEVAALAEWLRARLGFDPGERMSVRRWLSSPQPALLEITSGAVLRDDLGELTQVRECLAWYPDQVWLWLLACQWRRIEREEPFVGRAPELGDQLGTQLIAARVVRELMRLGFLLERRYAPYEQWLGSAFAQLDAGREIGGRLVSAVSAEAQVDREEALTDAVEALAARHNALHLTRRIDPVARFADGPARVLDSGAVVDACLERVSDPLLLSLPLVGAIDQFIDSTDVLSNARVFAPAGGLIYQRWGGRHRA